MRPSWIVAVSFAVGSFAAAAPSSADDAPPPTRAPAPPEKPGTDLKKDDAKAAATLRVERAKALVKELEELVAKAKAAQPIDAQLLQKLMEALDAAKALAQPAKPEELTADEKKAVVDEAKKVDPAAGKYPPNPLNDFQERALAKAFEGADLSEEESIKAKQIIGDWYKENLAAMGDSKKVSDLKRKRDDDLEKALGKKARKVINNLNAMGPGRR